jgi:hypothetical protein
MFHIFIFYKKCNEIRIISTHGDIIFRGIYLSKSGRTELAEKLNLNADVGIEFGDIKSELGEWR